MSIKSIQNSIAGLISKAEALVEPKLKHVAPKATLVPSGFKTAASAIAQAQASGALTHVSLDALPLDRSYTPRQPVTAMKHQKPVGFRWNAEDEQTPKWFPQAVTTSSDANPTGKVNGRDWVAVTWHADDNKSSRISFVDYTHPGDPKSAKYTNVDLVMADPKNPGKFVPVPCHVGGVTWVGHTLYVADTHGGMRVFDVNQLSKVTDPSAVKAGTTPVVLPQTGFYQVPALEKGAPGAPIFSGLSLDREHNAIVSQEYTGNQKGGRIMRWPVDLKTGALTATDGTVHASDEYSVPLARVAGVLARGDGFEIATMGDPGGLYRTNAGGAVKKKDTLAKGIQQFSWDAQRQQIWTLDEHPGHRDVWHFKPE